MSNKYLTYYATKQNPQYAGLLDDAWSTITEPLDVAVDYWTDKGVAGGLGEFATEVQDYSSTQKEASKRNEQAFEHKIKIAEEYKNAGSWPENIPRNLTNLNRAYPNLTSTSNAIGVPPNSIADAYAQGAIFSFLSAKLFNEPQFNQLGNEFIAKAESSSSSIGKEDTIKQSRAQKIILLNWLKVATETGVISSWYNLIGQMKNLISGEEATAISIKKRIKLFEKPAEINFSKTIAEQSSSSVWDLLYIMRGWLGLLGLVLLVIYASTLFGVLAVYVPGFAPAAGRAAAGAGRALGKAGAGAGRAIGKAGKGAGRAISGAMRSSVMDAVKEASFEMQKDQSLQKTASMLSTQLLQSGAPLSSNLENQISRAQQNPNLSEADLKRIIRQVIAETGV